MTEFIDLARKLEPVARAAGAIELHYFRSGTAVIDKQDGSPVTIADQEAEKLIKKALMEIAPDIPMVGEESVAANDIPDISSGTFWLVDPLDGTREFITGSGDFTVNIALMRDFQPVMGVIYAPVADELYYGAVDQAYMSLSGAPAEKISMRAPPTEGLTVVASKRHGDPERLQAFLQGVKVAQLINRSSSLKFCALAAGQADLYPRLGPTCEWDTAAGDAILRAAGGKLTQIDGSPFIYGKHTRKFLNPDFVAGAA